MKQEQDGRFPKNGSPDSLNPERVALWATQTIYFAMIGQVHAVGGPTGDKGIQGAIWEQALAQSEGLWGKARAEMSEGSNPGDFITSFAAKVLTWACSPPPR